MIYNRYARIYDHTGQMHFSILMNLYLQDLLRAHPVTGRSVIDLACGTGTLALLMAERGWSVLGIDRSVAMLAEAGHKVAAVAPIDVQLMEADMRDFVVDSPVDLITCCYDSLNYLLTEDDLQHCFNAVARALLPGGLFCFDLVTDFFLQQYWQGIQRDEGDDWSQIMQSSYDPTSGCSTLILTGFVRDDTGAYQRFQEVHVERAYPEASVRVLLEAAGLAVEAVYDCFTTQPPNDRSLRLMYLARPLS